MTPDLKALAIAARDAGDDDHWLQFSTAPIEYLAKVSVSKRVAFANFHAAASPSAVLALIEENERLQAQTKLWVPSVHTESGTAIYRDGFAGLPEKDQPK